MHGAHNTCRKTCILSAKIAHALMYARLCNSAEASSTRKLLRTYLESCASILQASFTACSCHPSCCLDQPPSPDAFRSRILSKSTLSHDAVAAAVSHKHHSSVRVGAGLIQFVYVSHCAWPRTSPSQSSSFAKVFAGFLSKSNHQ